MQQVAVFVDAGYLYAQASILLTGRKQPRPLVSLDETATVAALLHLALEKSEGGRLLRIYWYDGAPYGNPTPDQARIADLAYVRLRLGLVNSVGEQKGVDSLIMTDMMELARNHAISDSLLLSGDEDVRMGMHVAQSFGVRVHLLGIAPIRESQSYGLRRDADTATEWTSDLLRPLLSFRETTPVVGTGPLEPIQEPVPVVVEASEPRATQSLESVIPVSTTQPHAEVSEHYVGAQAGQTMVDSAQEPVLALQQVAANFASQLTATGRTEVLEDLAQNRGIPHFWDRKMLVSAGTTLNRDLQPWEKRMLREAFVDQLHPES